MILRRFRPHSEDRSIRDLYGAIVAQARRAAFYRSYGVPDTVQGRFNLREMGVGDLAVPK